MRASTIIKKIGCPHLSLYRGEGYWYFVYDNLDAGGKYDTYSVYTPRLSDLPACSWVSDGQDFVRRMEGRA